MRKLSFTFQFLCKFRVSVPLSPSALPGEPAQPGARKRGNGFPEDLVLPPSHVQYHLLLSMYTMNVLLIGLYTLDLVLVLPPSHVQYHLLLSMYTMNLLLIVLYTLDLQYIRPPTFNIISSFLCMYTMNLLVYTLDLILPLSHVLYHLLLSMYTMNLLLYSTH